MCLLARNISFIALLPNAAILLHIKYYCYDTGLFRQDKCIFSYNKTT
jgi:hypothetical protein